MILALQFKNKFKLIRFATLNEFAH